MTKGLIGLLSLVLVGMLAGCGSETGTTVSKPEGASRADMKDAEEGSATVSEAPAEEAAAETAAEAVAEVVTEAAEEMKEEAPAEAPAEAAAVVDGLVGTKWVHDGIDLTFKEGNKVHLKGGPLAAVAPDGLDADYTLTDGKIEVSVMGETYSGTYDGSKLIVDGKDAVLQQQ